MRFLVCQGIGDSVWSLHKVQAIRDKLEPGGTIDVYIACGGQSELESRAVDFVRRFPFVNSAEMFVCGGLGNLPHTLPDGRYNYMEDGWYDYDGARYCVLTPNATLEHGERLESWLPHYEIDWNIFRNFRITPAERGVAEHLSRTIGPYAVFYPGPLAGNTICGHNRNSMWKPTDWLELGRQVRSKFNLDIVTVGASYDASYYDHLLKPLVNGEGSYWHNLIGQTNLGELWSITSRAQFVISYQAGVGIISTYLGTPTAIFWRPEGNSISPDFYLSFDERMASAWVPPEILAKGTHLPLIYGRHDIGYIMDTIRSRQWVKGGSHGLQAKSVRSDS